jgi:hypothetical protein
MKLQIEPVEELEVTVKTIHETFGTNPVETVVTRRKGLHWITEMSGARVLVVESATMDAGPKYGTTLCFTPHSDTQVSEEERAANRARIQQVTAKVMTDMGIW